MSIQTIYRVCLDYDTKRGGATHQQLLRDAAELGLRSLSWLPCAGSDQISTDCNSAEQAAAADAKFRSSIALYGGAVREPAAATAAQPEGVVMDRATTNRLLAFIDVYAEAKWNAASNGVWSDAYTNQARAEMISALREQELAAATAAQPATLTDEQLIACIRSAAAGSVPMGLLRDRGPYEVTEPTWFARNLADTIVKTAAGATEGGND